MKVLFTKVKPDAQVPQYQTHGSSGADLHACINEPITIAPGTTAMIPTGIALELPAGYEAQVRSRSGLSAKHTVFVLNSPGTIDNDYRGEIMIILANFGKSPFVVENNMRIAQMVFAKFEQLEFAEHEVLSETKRGSGGFGSTGA